MSSSMTWAKRFFTAANAFSSATIAAGLIASSGLLAIAAPETVQLIGSIDNHFGINMTYTRDGEKIEGSYRYGTSKKALTIKGTIDGSGKFRAQESDASGHKTGSFSGQLIDSKRIVGTWSKPDGDAASAVPFLLCLTGKPGVLDQGKDGILLTQQKKRLAKIGHPTSPQADISLPVVNASLIDDKHVAELLQNALSVKNMSGQSMNEWMDGGWLDEMNYVVNYNRNYLLDCDLNISGCAAYPSGVTRHLLLDTKTGKRLKAIDVFKADTIKALKDLVNKKIDAEAKQAINQTASEQNEDLETVKELLKEGRKGDPLEVFSINDKGVTFRHDWSFPHAALALQPDGTYFFPFSELASYIKH